MKVKLFFLLIFGILLILVNCSNRIKTTISNTGDETVQNIKLTIPGNELFIQKLEPGVIKQIYLDNNDEGQAEIEFENSNGIKFIGPIRVYIRGDCSGSIEIQIKNAGKIYWKFTDYLLQEKDEFFEKEIQCEKIEENK